MYRSPPDRHSAPSPGTATAAPRPAPIDRRADRRPQLAMIESSHRWRSPPAIRPCLHAQAASRGLGTPAPPEERAAPDHSASGAKFAAPLWIRQRAEAAAPHSCRYRCTQGKERKYHQSGSEERPQFDLARFSNSTRVQAWTKNTQRRIASHRSRVQGFGASVPRRVDKAGRASSSSCPIGAAWRTAAQAPTREERHFAAPQTLPTHGVEYYARDAAAPDRLLQGNLAANLDLAGKQIHVRQTSHTSTKLLRAANKKFAAPDLPAS